MKPISPADMEKILGHRPSQAERMAFYEPPSVDKVYGNRPPEEAVNPYAKPLADLLAAGESGSPADRKRCRDRIKRFQKQADEWDATHAAQRERELTRLRMVEHPDVQMMQGHFAQVLSNCEPRSAQDSHDTAECLKLIDEALDGDESAITRYYDTADAMMQRRLEGNEPTLQALQKQDVETRQAHCAAEAEQAGIKCTLAQAEFDRARLERPSE